MANPIVMARTCVKQDKSTYTAHYYWCPGCDSLHGIAINPGKQENGAGWDFSGTMECPTYSPSQLSSFDQWMGEGKPPKKFVCHTFIRQGKIQFLNDCTHALKGKTVPLPPLPDWFVKERSENSKE